jgi:hypothetical protein
MLVLKSVGRRMLRSIAIVAGVSVATATATAQSPSGSPVPSDSEIRRILAERIDGQRQSIGMVEPDEQGRAARLILHQNGHDMPAPRIEE